MDEMIKYLKALVLFEVQTQADPEGAAKPEVVLSRSGFAHKEIAELLGKNPAAVAKAISRERASQKRG